MDNPILSFGVYTTPRVWVLRKWFRILESLTNVSNVTFTGCDLHEKKFQKLMETLRYLPHLSVLNLDGNQITSLLPLAPFASTGIWHLKLGNNEITDLTGLELFAGLTFLELTQNEITSITPLQNLAALRRLDLSRNRITSVSGLQSLAFLEYLNLGSNYITTVLPLQFLTHLEKLAIYPSYDNQINKTELNALRKKLPRISLFNCTKQFAELCWNHNSAPLQQLCNLLPTSRR